MNLQMLMLDQIIHNEDGKVEIDKDNVLHLNVKIPLTQEQIDYVHHSLPEKFPDHQG